MTPRAPQPAPSTGDRERLFELAIDLLGVAGFDGRFRDVNPACEAMLGWTQEEFVSRPFLDFVHPDDMAATARELQQLGEGVTTVSFENRYRCKNGEYRWLLWSATPAVDQELIYAVAHDVTVRKRAEQERDQYDLELRIANGELARADRVKNQFLAMASHELRTPLTAISGFTSTMLNLGDRLTDEQHVEFLRIIDRQATRLSRLVDDLLTLSKIEAGKLDTNPAELDVAIAIKQMLHDEGLEEKVAFQGTSVAAIAVVDPGHLLQILSNFVSNARKYGEAPVEIRVHRAGEQIDIEVCDRGAGVPAHQVPELFERFSRGSLHVQSEITGTGLGLSIVRGLARAQGGDAWYEPNQPTGSRFVLRLPTSSDRGI